MATAYIDRTQGTGTSTTQWTISMWVKRGTLGAVQRLMMAGDSSGAPDDYLFFQANDTLKFNVTGGAGILITNSVFRDVGAWYHIVAVWDSPNDTAGDRMKLYINGVEETSFATDTNPAEDTASTGFNVSGEEVTIGRSSYSSGEQYFDGEMSWVQFVDGAALAPTEFGSVDATSGIWKIKPGAYATPGNNGFCLAMEDRSNLDLDTSSNAHTFTTGGTLTATYDNPSNNFATLNPLENYWQAATFSQGNNTVIATASKYAPSTSTLGMGAGKWYWEAKAAARSGGNDYMVGVASTQTTGTQELGNWPNDWAYMSGTGNYRNDNTNTSYGTGYDTGDIIGVALDLTNSKLYFSLNGTWQDSGDPTSGATGTGAISITAVASTPLGAYFAGVAYDAANVATFNTNFGNGYFGTTAVTSANADDAGIGAMEYDVPAGYYCLCTKNIKAYGG